MKHACLTPLMVLGFVMLGAAMPDEARADFKVCNDTAKPIGVSLGQRSKKGWVTQGWWLIPAEGCAPLVKGKLTSRYFYLFAEEEREGGQWRGPIFMCTSNKQFKINGIKDCYARGHEQMGFFEVDTGQQSSWQVRLTERGRKSPSAVDGTTNPASSK